MALVIDSGVLYAYLDADDAVHAQSLALLAGTREKRVIPSPVLVEVDYLSKSFLGRRVYMGFIEDIVDGSFFIEDLRDEDYERVGQIMRQYADANIGFVDAAVLAVVERLSEPKLATIDHRHFGMLRPRHVDALQLVPEL